MWHKGFKVETLKEREVYIVQQNNTSSPRADMGMQSRYAVGWRRNLLSKRGKGNAMQINSINISELQSELDKWGGQACADNGSRLITHDDRTIRLYLKQSQQMEYASYAPNTYYLMASPNYCSYSYDYKAGRTKVELMPYYNAGTRQKHNVGTLLLQWYKHGGNIDEFVQMFPQIAEELRANKQTTDHVNSDIHNHCIWNLSQMTSIDNLHKTDYVARIKPPYYCYPIITADNKYRIRFGYETPFGQGQEMHIKCETSELFLAFLSGQVCTTTINDGRKRVYRLDSRYTDGY